MAPLADKKGYVAKIGKGKKDFWGKKFLMHRRMLVQNQGVFYPNGHKNASWQAQKTEKHLGGVRDYV